MVPRNKAHTLSLRRDLGPSSFPNVTGRHQRRLGDVSESQFHSDVVQILQARSTGSEAVEGQHHFRRTALKSRYAEAIGVLPTEEANSFRCSAVNILGLRGAAEGLEARSALFL
jgi:hypothetical protein